MTRSGYKNSRIFGVLLALGAVGALTIGAAPAPSVGTAAVEKTSAVGIQSVTSASGSHTCGPNQQVYIRATLDDWGAATITKTGSGGFSTVQIGVDLYYAFGSSTVGWEVYAPSGIATISDGCVVAF